MEKNQNDQLLGRVLGKRFKVLQLIGRGGMANVYKGVDEIDHSVVALKILKTEYVSDQEFVKRFDIEAKSAASLNHPNIVKVYGVGEDAGVRYMVMQYIEGSTLKDVIEEYGYLDWPHAVHYTLQVAEALKAAHMNGIIHRDIKPQNIMVTPNNQALVTDFGIARASNSHMITIAGAQALGSVHYFSPEQARGGVVGVKADIYSLGVTLYEMLTGSLPFEGDSSVSVALMHLQADPQAPYKLRPTIPAGLSNIVLKCLRKHPNERYADVQSLINELLAFSQNPEGEYGKIEHVEESKHTPLLAPKIDVTTIEDISKRNEEIRQKRRKTTLFVGILMIVLMLLLIYMAYMLLHTTPLGFSPSPAVDQENQSFVIDNYVNQKLEDVVKQLDGKAIKYNVVRKESNPEEAGKIIEQNLPANTKLSSYSHQQLILVVGSGRNVYHVPDLTGKTLKEAQEALDALGLVSSLNYEDSEEIEKDVVIRTEPVAGKEVSQEQQIVLWLSNGPQAIEIPDLTGMSLEEARHTLEDQGLNLGLVEYETFFTFNISGLTVKKSSPPAGTRVEKDTEVDLVLH